MVGFPDGSAVVAAARARADPEVELALLRAYQIDVTDPATDLRRIHLALTHLPMGMWPDPQHAASWSVSDYLLANLIDAVRELSWITVKVNAGKGQSIKRPEPCYRPGAKQASARAARVRWADLPRALGAVRE